jgi:putative membrane protein
MKKCIALSTAVLAATFTFAPLAGAQTAQQNAQQQAQQAQQRAQQEAQNAQNQARQAGSQVHGEADQAMQHNPDQMFLREAAADNQFEIQEAQFVQQQAQNEQVKQLAQQIVQDHQQAQQQLQQIAQQANMQVPSQLEEWQQAKLQHMQRHHGEMLDRAFTFGQVGGHTADILKYRYEAEHGQNAQIKQFAQQQIPTLEHHLQMARQTAEQWVPEARTAGEHLRGTGASEHTPGQPGSSTPGNPNGTNAGNTGTGTGNTGTGRTNSGVNR